MPRTWPLMWLIFWLSAAVLGFEIALMRMLLVASWHHFAFLVISIALLGFGASGTALTFARNWIMGLPRSVLLVLALAAAGSMPLCAGLAQSIPVEAKFLPSLIWRQVGCWVLFWGLLFVPFLLGASGICAALMVAREKVAAVYGANLLGSAAGAVIAPLCMFILPPAMLPFAMTLLVWIGAAVFRSGSWRVGIAGWIVSLAMVGAWPVFDRPHVRIDPYKFLAYVQRLENQNAASRIAMRHRPRGVVEAWHSDALHNLPFLGTGENPPPLSMIIIDGHPGGSVLEVTGAEDAAVMERTLMSIPYELAPPQPRVALLGEIGGTNIWLALRHDATAIDAVQPYADVVTIMRNTLGDTWGKVLEQPSVNAVIAEPRHFIEQTDRQYDLIELVTLESSSAGSGGVGGMGQDYMITVQGIEACLDGLSEYGVLFSCRGIQMPARDNIKLLATYVEALHWRGVTQPERHIVIVRDYLAVCIMVKASPWEVEEIERVRALCKSRQLTPVWFEGIRSEELNQPDSLPPPPTDEGIGDEYYYGAGRLFSPDADAFVDGWAFDVRSPTDDRPFFLDFCRVRSIGALRNAFGDLWLTRAEIAFLFVLAAMALIVVFGAALTVLPLVFLRGVRRSRGRLATAGYFAAIGLGYLLLEMICLSRLGLWIGDPVTTAAVVIASFLVFSGAGSLTAQRVRAGDFGLLRMIIALLVVLTLIVVFISPTMVEFIGGAAIWARCGAALLAVAPLGYLMGFPMPLALARLDRAAPALLPWAWGVNGFASVLAAPLATAIGMTWGFSLAAIAAAILYALAGAAFTLLPDVKNIAPGDAR
ncbi:MAG: hypothetical protein JSV91_01760 [Phycisphaerales bacterium]|nr:MAG: hypothetical protein JSV91_01760 [Phycisphaerales bacterium]